MTRLRRLLARHRVATFCIVTFALTWLFWLIAVYPQALPRLVAGEDPLSGAAVMLAVGAGMFFPAIGVVITRLLTGEGFKNLWFKPMSFKRTWLYYVIGWLGPILLVAVGALVYFLLFPNDFDPSMASFVDTMAIQLQSVGQSVPTDSELRQIALMQLGLVFVAPLLNVFTCFGEEWGWRGYLLPHLMERHSVSFSVITSGIIWGLWHAPITVLGHNYGLGYPGWPVTGILAMVCFCVVIGCFFSWMTLRAQSCLPAVLAHGALNGCANAPLMFAAAPNPFVGPAPTGIVGGVGFIMAAIVCMVSLGQRGCGLSSASGQRG